MAVKLGFEKSTKRWVKMTKGQRFYSTVGVGVRQAQTEYNVWFNSKFGAINEFEQACEQASSVADNLLSTLGVTQKAKPTDIHQSLNRKTKLKSLIEVAAFKNPKVEVDSLEKLTKEFLALKTAKLNHDSTVPLRSHLKFLTDRHTSLELTVSQWEAMVSELHTMKKNGVRSGKYCNSILNTMKAFYEWAKSRIKVPDFVFADTADNRITIPKTRAVYFSPEELKALLDAADPEMKIILLLMLNCGMTQVDISELTWEMINLEAGTLTRMRTKHEHRGEHEKVLTVVYSLWSDILTYLKRMKEQKGLIFTRLDGSALVQEKRNDQLAKRYQVLASKVGQKEKTLKHLRKTGTTVLGSSYKDSDGKVDFRSWREVYLANTPKEVTDVNYDGTTDLPKGVTDYIKKRLEV
ncbi:hypothetical protein [Schlesneria sp. DSM 10557]|uniref:hypothetical protein n=1 Tax=Schlesneria sp. DSM 10557 TaxID=3044399 RepID=UPI00359F8A30